MIQSFNPRELFDIAVQLGDNGTTEARLRSAINRAYYAVFWLARKKTGVSDRHDSHLKVVQSLKRMSGFNVEGDRLDAFRRLRGVADYDLVPQKASERDWERNWRKAKEFAQYLLQRL